MNFNQLVTQISSINRQMRNRALHSIDHLLVIRNWLIGFYIVEYEQQGTDRANYGEKLLQAIESDCKKKSIKGLSATNLKLCRQFYQVYPEIGQPVADTLRKSQPVADQLDNNHIFNVIIPLNKEEQLTNHPAANPEVLLRHFSFRHFTELIKVKRQTDNEPVGIILCTAKDHEKVQYATAGLSNHMFVSKYMLTLPSEEELLALVKPKEIRK